MSAGRRSHPVARRRRQSIVQCVLRNALHNNALDTHHLRTTKAGEASVLLLPPPPWLRAFLPHYWCGRLRSGLAPHMEPASMVVHESPRATGATHESAFHRGRATERVRAACRTPVWLVIETALRTTGPPPASRTRRGHGRQASLPPRPPPRVLRSRVLHAPAPGALATGDGCCIRKTSATKSSAAASRAGGCGGTSRRIRRLRSAHRR